jgi:hypothetical protein
MSVATLEASTAEAFSPNYCALMKAETGRIRHALDAFNHKHVTRLHGTARNVAEAVIMAFAFPTIHGPHYEGVSRTTLAIQQAEFMISSDDRNHVEACRIGIAKARSALQAAYDAKSSR